MSDETKEVLYKAGAMHTLLAVTKTVLPEAKRNMQAAVAALLLLKLMSRGTHKSSSHHRSVLRDKGCTLCTVSKGVHTGPNPSLFDKRITDR